jgi:predicted ATPase/signal transduction histidine kinase
MSLAALPLSLPGYQFLEPLYTGSRTAVYRALKTIEGDSAKPYPVVIKLLQQDYPCSVELLKFRNQYTITKNLDIPGIIRPLSLEPYGNSYALVMEYLGDVSLRNYTQKHSLSITEVLAIAIQLADTLHDLYQHRIIHKDIKPANILIHPDSRQVKLIDFSIASQLPKETEEIKHPNILEGTLAYLAPEQTGRMNRGIDYRTDFYSLGVTLYELLSGQLPFRSEDPLELMHCHIAKPAPFLSDINPEIPTAIGQVIAKLMAKNAEDRYQSALGLRHDLEICLHQLKSANPIAEFQLGARDVSDRFTIPEKLYGRELEVQSLLAAFERVSLGASEMMLVAGFSGIGKTVVVNEVHKPIARQRGYFIKGKFDQFNRNIPLSAFVQAFRDLMGQLLGESDAQRQLWQTQVLTALGNNGQIIIDVIPELEQMIGAQPPVPELSGTAAQNRFYLLLQKFIGVFTTPDHPLVIFLDDLQWADTASLNLMQVLMTESAAGYMLLLGAYRDNEVFAAHPFMLTLESVKKANATVNTIALQPLGQDSLNHLIADTLHCSISLGQPLTELVMQKTQGNPFFVTQFLKALHEDGLITFDTRAGHWQCDIGAVRDAALTDDIVEFMALQLQKLPHATQLALQFAACIGAQFDLQTLAIVSQQSASEVATALWKSLQEGLILPQSEVYKFYLEAPDLQPSAPHETLNYRFLHDRIQQAAYSLIPDAQKPAMHLSIGHLLLEQSAAVEERIFAIVSQFNLGIDQVESPAERDAIAQLNLNAARKARLSAAYAASAQYCEMALHLVPHVWQQQPLFALELYLEAANSACLIGAFEQVDRAVALIYQHNADPLVQSRVLEVQIQSLIARNRLADAIRVARSILQQLGVTLPEQPTSEMLPSELERVRQQLEGIDVAALAPMNDSAKLAAMKILTSMGSAAYIGSPALYPLIVLKQIELSLEFGTTIETPYAFATYGLILCAFGGEIVAGNHSADIAIELMEKFQADRFKAKILNLVHPFTRIWQSSLQLTLEPLRLGYQAGLESGDLEFAAYCAYNRCKISYAAGNDLLQLQVEMQQYGDAIAQLKQSTALNFHQIGQQAVLNWIGESASPQDLIGTAYDETVRLAQHQAAADAYSIGTYSIHKLILTYHFDTPQAALAIAQSSEAAISSIIGTAFYGVFPFYYALTLLANWHEIDSDQRDETVTSQLDRLTHWAEHAPMNFSHRCQLIRAEQQRVLGNHAAAIELYDAAIALAKANQYLPEEALANELAAQFYLNWGKEKVAAGYLQAAYYGYAHWGAKAKTDALETRYPQLLQPILRPASQPFTVLETLAAIAPTTHTTHSRSSSSASLNHLLDFATLLKTSQAMSSTIKLDALMVMLCQTMMENSGADRSALILPQNGEWQVRVLGDLEQTLIQSVALEQNHTVPVNLIQSVKNSLTEVVIHDSKQHSMSTIDEYLNRHQPQSLVCLPLMNQGNLVGILYLENRSTGSVFTNDRLLVLNFLTTQAAIALENARLYHQVQQAFNELQQAQLQMVQSEKMSALGNLVAGVAHEINNPIGCIVGNVGAVRDSINDLFNVIDLYQQKFPQPGAEIEEELESIDLEYLRDDLPKLVKAMKDGGDRIKSISRSLRTFSRADTDMKQRFNLHEGIDSTIMILRHRLNANEKRPAIEVLNEYGDIPLVDCFPGQLNQVFMNILANAIDALDEFNQERSLAEIQAQPNQIRIRTALENRRVEVTIADNGKGMPEEVRERIFDNLFTTKEVGKGTGLGLAIARQIIVEKHGGAIWVDSEVNKGTKFTIQIPA